MKRLAGGGIKNGAHGALGYIVFLIGMLLTAVGVCILLINLLRY